VSNIAQVGIHGFMNSSRYKRWAEEHGITIFPARQVRKRGIDAVLADAVEIASRGTDAIYLSVDLDSLSQVYCLGASGSITPDGMDARLDGIATVQLRFRPPAIGLIVTSWVLSGGSPGIRVRFHGSEGLAEAEVTSAVPGGQAYRRITLDGVAQKVPLHGLDDAIGARTARHIDDVVALVQGRPSPYPGTLPTLRDGARVQRVLDAAPTATGNWGDISEHDTLPGGIDGQSR